MEDKFIHTYIHTFIYIIWYIICTYILYTHIFICKLVPVPPVLKQDRRPWNHVSITTTAVQFRLAAWKFVHAASQLEQNKYYIFWISIYYTNVSSYIGKIGMFLYMCSTRGLANIVRCSSYIIRRYKHSDWHFFPCAINVKSSMCRKRTMHLWNKYYGLFVMTYITSQQSHLSQISMRQTSFEACFERKHKSRDCCAP